MNDISILLVEDHPIVRQKYRELLARDGVVRVVAEAENGEQACELFTAYRPDVVVMDLSLPGMNGLQAMQRILQLFPDARILILSMHEERVYVKRAICAGACGYVTKAYAPDVLSVAVHEVAQGRTYISDDIAPGANQENGKAHFS